MPLFWQVIVFASYECMTQRDLECFQWSGISAAFPFADVARKDLSASESSTDPSSQEPGWLSLWGMDSSLCMLGSLIPLVSHAFWERFMPQSLLILYLLNNHQPLFVWICLMCFCAFQSIKEPFPWAIGPWFSYLTPRWRTQLLPLPSTASIFGCGLDKQTALKEAYVLNGFYQFGFYPFFLLVRDSVGSMHQEGILSLQYLSLFVHCFYFCCMGWSFVQPPSQWIAGEDWERPYRSLHLHLKPLFVSGASTKANRTGVSTEADLMSQWRAVKRREAQCHQMTQWDPGRSRRMNLAWMAWTFWRRFGRHGHPFQVIMPGFLAVCPSTFWH